MFQLRITCYFCAAILLQLSTGARAADPSVVVTLGDDGTVNVLAQCAPVEEVLAAIAQAEGSKVEFAERLNSLVTLADGSAFKNPDLWISDITTGLNLTSSHDGTTWHFSRIFPDRYDPTLTASEILTQYGSSTDPGPLSHALTIVGEFLSRYGINISSATPTNGVRGAVLVLDGQYIMSPYEVIIAKRSWVYRLAVNGVHVSGIDQVESVEILPLPPADMPGFQLRDNEELYRYISSVHYPALRKSMDVESALEEAARFLRSQDIVEEVTVKDEHPRIWMTLAGFRYPSSALPFNYDLDTATVYGGHGPPPQMLAESQAEVLRKQLSQPALVVLGKTGRISISGMSHLRECAGILRRANELGVLELECALVPFLGDRQLAREVAANAGQNPAPLIAALDNLIMQKQALSQKETQLRTDTLIQEGEIPSPAE